MPWTASFLLGGGSFVIGAVAPLYDSYVPPLLQRHLSSSGWVGAAMGIDNVLALALAAIPFSDRYGLLALLAAMIVVDIALAVWRAPFSALLAELVPSSHRSKTEGILGMAMCLGAMLNSVVREV